LAQINSEDVEVEAVFTPYRVFNNPLFINNGIILHNNQPHNGLENWKNCLNTYISETENLNNNLYRGASIALPDNCELRMDNGIQKVYSLDIDDNGNELGFLDETTSFKIPRNDYLYFPGLASSSQDIGVCLVFMNTNFGMSVIYIIDDEDNISANIVPYSTFQQEEESLFPFNTRFIITNIIFNYMDPNIPQMDRIAHCVIYCKSHNTNGMASPDFKNSPF